MYGKYGNKREEFGPHYFYFLRFGEKYTLIITIADQCRREDLICSVKEIFPGSIEKGAHSTCLLWDITKNENDR